MATLFKRCDGLVPAPGTVKCAMNQDELRHADLPVRSPG
jgi:hypothetical protein